MTDSSELQVIASKKFEFYQSEQWQQRTDSLFSFVINANAEDKIDLLRFAKDNFISLLFKKQMPDLKAIFIDFDHTLVEQESLVALAQKVGCEQEVFKITKQAMAGELDFAEGLKKRLKLFAGVSASLLAEVSVDLKLRPGIEGFMKNCQSKSIKTYMVTGGFTEICMPIIQKLDFTGYIANNFEVEGQKLTGKPLGKIIDAQAKADFVLNIAKQEGFSLDQCMAIGDGANDLPMLKTVQNYSVGFDPKKVLLDHIDGVVFDYDFLSHLTSF